MANPTGATGDEVRDGTGERLGRGVKPRTGNGVEYRAQRSLARIDERARAIAFLDLEERRGPVPVLDEGGIAEVLRSARRIAVIGASSNPARPSYGVFRYLLDAGYDVLPVNPNETEVHGRPAFASLAEAVAAGGPVEIVDVFRRSELCAAHAREAVAAGARCLWLQLGVVSWEAAQIAAEAGLSVVMDRCTAVEHRRLVDLAPAKRRR
jgi:predicted CoA-binding protein